MKKSFIIVLFVLTKFSFAQNLVSNPSFEQYDTCPFALDQVKYAIGWSSYRPSPDYFNNCSGRVGFNNPISHRIAHTGNAYCGFETYDYSDVNYREHIGSQLISQLQVDAKYYVSLYINKATGAYTMATNKIGVLFSTIPYNNNTPSPVNNFAQVYADSLVMDTTDWYHLKGSFIADSLYNYIIIGCFFDDNHVDTIHTNPFQVAIAYYFVDDICVSTDSTVCFSPNGIEVINTESVRIYPNPADNLLIIRNNNEPVQLIKIYNVTGLCVYNDKEPKNQNEYVINTTILPNGFYAIEMVTKNNLITKSIIINHN